jgi:hypothetical protein
LLNFFSFLDLFSSINSSLAYLEDGLTFLPLLVNLSAVTLFSLFASGFSTGDSVLLASLVSSSDENRSLSEDEEEEEESLSDESEELLYSLLLSEELSVNLDGPFFESLAICTLGLLLLVIEFDEEVKIV